jgi:Trm5-related predicted tRNA methylase
MSIENKIQRLIEEASSNNSVLGTLDSLLKEKWDWSLKDDIKEKFNSRFSKIKKVGNKFEAWDTKKDRAVILDPNVKSFVIVKETKNQCGFLRGAVTASKRNN